MSLLRDKIATLSFDIRTIKWISHREKDSDYDNGWNDALDAIERELLLALENSELCTSCKFYEVRPRVPDWNICNAHADYRSSDEFCSSYEKRHNG